MMEPTVPVASVIPSCGRTQPATSAPMMPTTMLPISPNPAPWTILPASQPAIAPMISAAIIPIAKIPKTTR